MKKEVLNGIDNLDELRTIVKNKKVGLITSTSGVNKDLKYTIDVINENFKLVALYSPEHGIRGNFQAGEEVETYIDEKTGLKVYSLYGDNKKPTKDMLKEIDILIFDIGDVGTRYYTYIYSMGYCLEACKENNKKFILLDRINVLGGEKVEGNILGKEYKTFVGMYQIATRYGLTLGELAIYLNEEKNIGCDLEVIKLKGWERWMYQDDTDINWISPSPNMPTLETAILYSGLCLFEGTNLSEGRGTTKPFENIGAPWIDGYELANIMNEKNLEGVKFRPVYFTPMFSKYKNELCSGVQVHITDKRKINSYEVGLYLLEEVIKMDKDNKIEFVYSEEYEYFLDALSGTDILRKRLGKELTAKEVLGEFKKDIKDFKEKSKKYYLYK
jgi:uncharacterized protein YbbC (DUF1343 family)